MASGNQKRTRSERVAALSLPPGRLVRYLAVFRRGDVLLRIGMCLVAAVAIWGVTRGWAPPFGYRTGHVPPRDIVTRTEFFEIDHEATEALRKQRRSETICYYSHDPRPLQELAQALKDKVFQVLRAESYEAMEKEVWREFLSAEQKAAPPTQKQVFDDFRAALGDDPDLAQFERAVIGAISEFEKKGLLASLGHEIQQGSQTAIFVHPPGTENIVQRIEVGDVRIAKVAAELPNRLAAEMKAAKYADSAAELASTLAAAWLKPRLPQTLKYNEQASRRSGDAAAAAVEPVKTRYAPGETKLAIGGKPLNVQDLQLLRKEHDQFVAQMNFGQMLSQSAASFGMYAALYVLCGFYIYYRQPQVLASLRQFATLLFLAALTVGLCWYAAHDQWRAEIVPLLLFGMMVAIAHQHELALLLAACVALVATISRGQGLEEMVILISGVATAVLLLRQVRTRTKLIYVGLFAGAVVMLTTVGVGTLVGQAFGAASSAPSPIVEAVPPLQSAWFVASLLRGAMWHGFCAVLAGVLMTGLLPFMEKLFDVQTDISLLELGDVAHPLLQELVRRAPGTYNHSINVASIAEAAAEAIGANGLLVRVGAYFHDIGKMLKPVYFIENQGQDANRHESLMPAMSTLVIIAHVKDGADLARQHRLPHSIIDFIEQHHGTTLVEYFYRQAAKKNEDNPGNEEVDETNFRYPGPKPQTKEAGVLMLADAVESASRTLVDPTPARIESLVHDMALKRLLDGQFDECGLTLKDLRTIENSLVKSLTAVYHGRVKYPNQQSA